MLTPGYFLVWLTHFYDMILAGFFFADYGTFFLINRDTSAPEDTVGYRVFNRRLPLSKFSPSKVFFCKLSIFPQETNFPYIHTKYCYAIQRIDPLPDRMIDCKVG